MFSKPNVLQEKKARISARLFRERKHSSYMGGGLLLLFTADLLGQVISIIITQCTIVRQKSHNVRYFYKKRATKKRERIWN